MSEPVELRCLRNGALTITLDVANGRAITLTTTLPPGSVTVYADELLDVGRACLAFVRGYDAADGHIRDTCPAATAKTCGKTKRKRLKKKTSSPSVSAAAVSQTEGTGIGSPVSVPPSAPFFREKA